MNKIPTAIEIADEEIRVFQVEKRKKGDRLRFADIRSIVCCSDEEISTRLKDMMSRLPGTPQNPALLMPRHLAILRQMKLPSHDDRELEDMIGLRLVNNTPYAVEEIIFRYHLLHQDIEGYSVILVIIMPRDVVLRYRKIMQEAGIKNGILSLSSFGILGWQSSLDRENGTDKSLTVALVNISPRNSEVCFCRDHKLFFSRDISYAGKPLTLNDGEELLRQIKLSLDIFHQGQLGLSQVGHIRIFAACDEAGTFIKQLEKEVGVSVEVVDPLNAVSCSGAVNTALSQNHQLFPVTAGLGSLLPERNNFVDFSHRETLQEKQRSKQRRWAINSAVVLLAAMVLSTSIPLVGIQRSKARLQALKAQSNDLQGQLRNAKEKIRIVGSFDRELAQYRFVPDLIDEFSRLVPEGIFFRRLSLSREGNMTVYGYADTHARVNDLQAQLIRSSRFYNVDLQFVANRKVIGKPLMDFKIAMQLQDEKEADL